MSSEHFKEGTKEWVRGILMSTLKHILQLICSQQEMMISMYLCISIGRERKYETAQGDNHLFLASPTSSIFFSLHKENHSWRQENLPERTVVGTKKFAIGWEIYENPMGSALPGGKMRLFFPASSGIIIWLPMVMNTHCFGCKGNYICCPP